MRDSRNKHEELEKQVLNSADHIITTSFTTKEEFSTKTKKPITLITNGYDSESYIKNTASSKFKLAHIGSLLSGRNPENLWKALQQLKKENEDFNKLFELQLAGKVSEEVLRSIEDHGLEENLDNKGYISHSKALKMQRECICSLID